MGTLRDEAYEKLDYLSKLTEVVIGPQNEALTALPDRIELSFDTISAYKHAYWNLQNSFEFSLEAYLADQLENLGLPNSGTLVAQIRDNFRFEVSPDFEIDFVNKVMVGTVALVKHSYQIEEKKLLEFAVNNAISYLASYDWPAKRLKERTITVLNTLEANRGIEWAQQLNGRVAGAAKRAISELLRNVILENKWRVRDAAVIAKMGQWINSYLMDTEEGVGLVNLIKLKFMIDRDLPVYSVDEVKSVNPN